MANVLIIEDDPDIQEVLRYNLGAANHQVRVATTGREGLRLARAERPDVVLLDLMLPDTSGTSVCKELKGDPTLRGVYVVIVSARGEEIDRVVGFELGADDYVVKPFSVRELVLRVQAVTRRAEAVRPANVASFRSLRFDRGAHRVWVDEKEVALTALELRLLLTLFDRQDRVQTREELVSVIWGDDPDVELRTIDTHVKRLREKLGAAGEYLQTVRGVGYRFSGESQS